MNLSTVVVDETILLNALFPGEVLALHRVNFDWTRGLLTLFISGPRVPEGKELKTIVHKEQVRVEFVEVPSV